RKPSLIGLEQAVAFNLKKCRPYLPAASREQHLRPPRQPLGTADMTIGSHDHHRLVLRVKTKPFGAQRGLGDRLGGRPGQSSNLCDCLGTTASHPRTWSMRERSASDACASPCTMKTRRGGR